MRIYARRVNNRDLEIDAAEIRVRSERRLGEMLAEAWKAGQIGTGCPKQGGPRVTLAQLGIKRKLSMSAQRLAVPDSASFEASLARWRLDLAAGGRKVAVPMRRANVGQAKPRFTLPDGRSLERVAAGEISALVESYLTAAILLAKIKLRGRVESQFTRVGEMINAEQLADIIELARTEALTALERLQ